MKRIIVLLLALLMALSIVGCKKDDAKSNNNTDITESGSNKDRLEEKGKKVNKTDADASDSKDDTQQGSESKEAPDQKGDAEQGSDSKEASDQKGDTEQGSDSKEASDQKGDKGQGSDSKEPSGNADDAEPVSDSEKGAESVIRDTDMVDDPN